MINSNSRLRPTVILAVLLLKLIQPKAAQAQPITAATDGTGTVVTQTGQSFDIGAGSLSSDGSNLFHSFQTFQLPSENTANFLADPSIQNIFARINSSNTAFINGQLQISGGPANLYLLNPGGVIFGPSATLNLPANLTVTTAESIGFEDGWFHASGSNGYGTLGGSPNAFAFGQETGTIRNEGNLALPSGQSITLLGNTVINTGTLTASDIIIEEVPEEQVVRISQTGSLITLEISNDEFQGDPNNLTSPSLPGLLTHGGAEHANQIVTNPDGQALLANGSGPLAPPPGQTHQAGPPPPSGFNNPGPPGGNHNHSDNGGSGNNSSTQHAQEERPSGDQRDNRQNRDNRGNGGRPDSKDKHQPIHRAALDTANASAAIADLEDLRNQEFTNYFGRDLNAKDLTLPQIQQLLTQVQTQADNQSIIVYVKTPKLATNLLEENTTALELLIFRAAGDPINLVVSDVSPDELFRTVEQFRRALVSSSRIGSKRYLPSSQKLYKWLIKPIEDELGSESIDTILFSMDSGLRTLPIAALHDGQQFLIEKYSLGMVPSLGLMHASYQSLEIF